MTLLQKATVNRLREAGYHSLADAAADAWASDRPCPLPNMVSARESELRADFEQANGQGAPSEDSP
jgi:hypothetical protein